MRKLVRLSSCLLLAVPAFAAANRPRLVVLVTIDQFRFDYLVRFRDEYTGGLARFLSAGAVYTSAHLEHYPTVTAAGHASLSTGAPPSLHGIVNNEWFDRETGRQVTSVEDDAARAVGGGGAGVSPHRLMVSTVGDELKLASGGRSRVYGISLKDRAAVLSGGRAADGAFWVDGKTGRFVTSSFYLSELPAWVQRFNDSGAARQYSGRTWSSRDGGTAFVTLADAAAPGYFEDLRATPFANEMVLGLAIEAVRSESLGKDEFPDLLSVSLSANDYAGHRWGPHSPEVRDLAVRTDGMLGDFFAAVEREAGRDRVLYVLAADHGVSPMPELLRQNRLPGGRLSEEELHKGLAGFLAGQYGAGEWIAGHAGPDPYLNHTLIRERKLDAAEVRRRAAAWLRNTPHILRVYTYDELLAGRASADVIDRRMAAGFHPGRGADLFLVAEPYWIFEPEGTTHGSPHPYDAHIALAFLGGGIRAGRYHERVAANDIAPTLAAILEIEVPGGSIGRVLGEMLAGEHRILPVVD
jgi:arylsulfatase A-like enzyme